MVLVTTLFETFGFLKHFASDPLIIKQMDAMLGWLKVIGLLWSAWVDWVETYGAYFKSFS